MLVHNNKTPAAPDENFHFIGIERQKSFWDGKPVFKALFLDLKHGMGKPKLRRQTEASLARFVGNIAGIPYQDSFEKALGSEVSAKREALRAIRNPRLWQQIVLN